LGDLSTYFTFVFCACDSCVSASSNLFLND